MIIRDIPVISAAQAQGLLSAAYESDHSAVYGRNRQFVYGRMITCEYNADEGVVHVNYSGNSENTLVDWLGVEV